MEKEREKTVMPSLKSFSLANSSCSAKPAMCFLRYLWRNCWREPGEEHQTDCSVPREGGATPVKIKYFLSFICFQQEPTSPRGKRFTWKPSQQMKGKISTVISDRCVEREDKGIISP